jgi:3-deoxy-D-manno-octulosonate 8-phosphate phosphatase (KDO 8-P phosphatase)
VEQRASELGITFVRQGVSDKLAVLKEMLAQLNLQAEVVATMGDDSADIPIMSLSRLAISVPDGHASAKQCAHYVTTAPGGLGAVREACDLILEARGTGSVR